MSFILPVYCASPDTAELPRVHDYGATRLVMTWSEFHDSDLYSPLKMLGRNRAIALKDCCSIAAICRACTGYLRYSWRDLMRMRKTTEAIDIEPTKLAGL